jgi:hypothetical protein
MLQGKDTRISTTGNGNPLENAVVGRVNGILKTGGIHASESGSLRENVYKQFILHRTIDTPRPGISPRIVDRYHADLYPGLR